MWGKISKHYWLVLRVKCWKLICPKGYHACKVIKAFEGGSNPRCMREGYGSCSVCLLQRKLLHKLYLIESKVSLGFSWRFQKMHRVDFIEHLLTISAFFASWWALAACSSCIDVDMVMLHNYYVITCKHAQWMPLVLLYAHWYAGNSLQVHHFINYWGCLGKQHDNYVHSIQACTCSKVLHSASYDSTEEFCR